MGRHKKVEAEKFSPEIALLRGLCNADREDNYGIMTVFMRGLQAGVSVGYEQAREEQRKREAAGNG